MHDRHCELAGHLRLDVFRVAHFDQNCSRRRHHHWRVGTGDWAISPANQQRGIPARRQRLVVVPSRRPPWRVLRHGEDVVGIALPGSVGGQTGGAHECNASQLVSHLAVARANGTIYSGVALVELGHTASA